MLNFDLAPDEVDGFLAETDEHLQHLGEDLVHLEKDPDNQQLLQEIFRIAHTMKGNAAYIGHHRMTDLTHAMESLLDCLRKGTRRASPNVVDSLLASLDLLQNLKTEITTRQPSPIDIEPVAARLRKLAECQDEAELPAAKQVRSVPEPDLEERIKAQAYIRQGLCVYEVFTTIAEGSFAPAVRALQILLELGQIGQVLWSTPSEAEIDAQQVSKEVCVWVATTQEEEAIHSALSWLIDVNVVEVCQIEENTSLWEQTSQCDPGQKSGDAEISTVIPFQASQAQDSDQVLSLSPDQIEGGEQGQAAKAGDESLASPNSAPLVPALRSSVRTVRTSVERLDNLMNLVGELVTDRNRLFQLSSDLAGRYGEDVSVARLFEAATHVNMITDQLQEEVMKARLVPIDDVFNKFPRLVRDLARKAGKEVELIIEGRDTELDRSVIEAINDPLMHILRNAVDHGIESAAERKARGKLPMGQIRLSARHQEDHILIVIADDGRGIDVGRVKLAAVERRLLEPEEAKRLSDTEALELIFMSGLTTAREVSDVSGRGVGMDVVRTNIERLNGAVFVHSQLGQGTVFEIKLPLTLAIMPALLVSVQDETYAIPLASVIETLRIHRSQLLTIRGKEVMLLRGRVLPILRPGEFFGVHNADRIDHPCIVAVKSGELQVGLVVDGLVGQQEVVVKSLSSFLGDLRSISGGTILGDGQVALIVDVASLIEMVRRERRGGE